MQLGLPAILFVVFLVLKLTDVISWSWLWVTSPLWISFILAIFAVIVWLASLGNVEKRFDKMEARINKRRR